MRKTEITAKITECKRKKERNEHEKCYYFIRIFIQSIWHTDADVNRLSRIENHSRSVINILAQRASIDVSDV